MQSSEKNKAQRHARPVGKRYEGLSFSRAKPQEEEWILQRLEKALGEGAKKMLAGRTIILGKRGGESEIFLAKDELLPWFDRIKQRTDPQSIGLYIGRMKAEIKLGIETSRMMGKRAIVGAKAEQLALYGRDVFLDSVLELRGGIRDGDLCAIANEKDEPLAIGRMEEKLNIIRNLVDRGEYIRGELYK